MSMYFYFLVALLVSCSARVAADTCFPLNATFAVSPQICYPTYSISELYAQNNTGGDRLSSLFITLSNADNLPSLECAEAFAEYYCTQLYPECVSGTTKSECASTCSAVVTACANYTSLFTDPDFPLPAQTDCDSLSATDCSAIPATNLTSWYTECATYNLSLVGQITPVCQPDYTVPVGNLSYTEGSNIYVALIQWIQKYTGATDESGPPDWMYTCVKAWSNFWCTDVTPQCPAGNVIPVLPVCKSVCLEVINQCNETVAQYFNPNQQWGYVMPNDSVCSGLNNNPGVDCFIPSGTYTNLTFFFGCDPPCNITATDAPTYPPYYNPGIQYPPGGPAKGGGIGAAVLVGILAFIGLLMLIMKKQDSR